MLATRVRERPCSSLALRSSLGRLTTSSPPSCETVMGSETVCESSPLGPLTLTVWPVMVMSTPAGTGIDLRPIRDMFLSLQLPDEGEDFPAHAPLAGLPVGQQPLGRRNDRDAQAAEHPREPVRLGVNPQTGLGHALDPRQAPL